MARNTDTHGSSGHTMQAQPRSYWYIACTSEALKKSPLACEIFGDPIVLFRDAVGQAAALLNRCAHRNVPLSGGKVVGSELQCPYHGWRYDTSGVCRAIPCLMPPAEGKARRVPAYSVREQQGYVWVYATPDSQPTCAPYYFEHTDMPGFSTVRYQYRFHASLYATLENILDVPHTAFLHGGLFRQSGGEKKRMTAVVRRGADRVEAEYVGEAVPNSFLGRVLAPGGGNISHWDRFILPSVAQVDYALGDSRVVLTDVLTPVGDFITDLYTVAAVRLPMATAAITKLLAPVARFVATQDARMLQQQTETVRRFGGEQFVSTEVDILGPHIARLLRHAERGETPLEAPDERVELWV